MTPLRLFCWQGVPNSGGAPAALLLKRVTGYLRGLKNYIGLSFEGSLNLARQALTDTFPATLRKGLQPCANQLAL